MSYSEHAPSVHVKSCIVSHGEQIGTFDDTFARCVADVFEDGILTITSVDNGYLMKEYRPDQWREVTVYAASGYPEYSHVNTNPVVALT